MKCWWDTVVHSRQFQRKGNLSYLEYFDRRRSGQASQPSRYRQYEQRPESTLTAYAGIYAANWLQPRYRLATAVRTTPCDSGTSSQYPVLKYGGLRVDNQRGGDNDGEDTTNVGSLSFTRTAISVSEGGTGNVLAEVHADRGPTTTAVAFRLTATDGTATGGHLIFPDKLATITVTLSDDTLQHPNAGETSAQGLLP